MCILCQAAVIGPQKNRFELAALVEIQYLEREKRDGPAHVRSSDNRWILLSVEGSFIELKDKMELIQKKAACILWEFESYSS